MTIHLNSIFLAKEKKKNYRRAQKGYYKTFEFRHKSTKKKAEPLKQLRGLDLHIRLIFKPPFIKKAIDLSADFCSLIIGESEWGRLWRSIADAFVSMRVMCMQYAEINVISECQVLTRVRYVWCLVCRFCCVFVRIHGSPSFQCVAREVGKYSSRLRDRALLIPSPLSVALISLGPLFPSSADCICCRLVSSCHAGSSL